VVNLNSELSMNKNIIYNNLNLNQDIKWIKDKTFFLTIHGSIAYGLDTPESDIDVRGITCIPREYVFGFNKTFNEYIASDPLDCTIFNIKKFFNLTSQGNPNTLELLFTEPEHHIYVDKLGEMLLQYRDSFLSKQLKERYIGYSKAQAHRIKQHRSWLLNPIETLPVRQDFGLSDRSLIPKNEFQVIKHLINKKLESWSPDFEPFSESQKIYLKNKVADILSEMNICHNDKWMCAARSIGLSENFIEILKKEKQFENKIEEYKNYQKWKINRNPKRAALEAKYGFDCFTDDTEFLTDNGFKKFDDITELDKLATVCLDNTSRKMAHRAHYLGVEYQNYTEKFDTLFNGSLHNFYGNHLDVCVTPNHRMIFRPVSKMFNKPLKEWSLESAANLGESFDFLKTIDPNNKNYNNGNVFDDLIISPEDYMKLMGAFISDGIFTFCKNKPVTIDISQKESNTLHSWMKAFYKKYKNKIPISLYEYKTNKAENKLKDMVAITLSISDKSLVNKLYNDCGSFKEKRIPRWVFGLSKKLMEIMYNHMHYGDSAVRNTHFQSSIYYTSVKSLADQVQELAILCGWEASIYGPYSLSLNNKQENTDIYHVHINKNVQYNHRLSVNINLRKIKVTNQRVVCFSVPNSTLIVRRNGHVSIQGNCKHATQLVRLLKLGKEILETGKVQVKRTYDREELLSIKNGAWKYQDLIDYADKMEQEVKVAYEKSYLPNQPNIKLLDNLCIKLIEQSLSAYSWYNLSGKIKSFCKLSLFKL
jgi:predicted nucleotidyltransferase